MLYEKLALVIMFLAALLAVQWFLYKRYKSQPRSEANLHGLRLHSRLSLSKNDQVNIVSAGANKFLIVSSRNASAAIMPLNKLSGTEVSERHINEE